MKRSSRPGRWLRGAVAIAAVAALATACASAATAKSWSAPDRICTPGSAGCVQFSRDLRSLYVCDYAADGHSVVSSYSVRGYSSGYLVNYWGRKSWNGCHTFPVHMTRNPFILVYDVCLADYGVPGGHRMVVRKSTCRSDSFSFN